MKFPSYIGPFSWGYQHLPTTTYNGETVSAGLPGPLRSVSPGRAEVPVKASRLSRHGWEWQTTNAGEYTTPWSPGGGFFCHPFEIIC